MNFEEFLKPRNEQAATSEVAEETVEQNVSEVSENGGSPEENTDGEASVDLDVQKAVVESLAADKVEQDEMIVSLRRENETLRQEKEGLSREKETLSQENVTLRAEAEELKKKIAEQNEALAKVGDVLAKNAETEGSNKVALLDRDLELPDRFPGETRDHVIEAIKEARNKAEADGRVRRAQILESVLVANEATGNLEKKRVALEKFFNENQNILSGPVIEELEKCGISHKKGEEYLLPSEILKRTY